MQTLLTSEEDNLTSYRLEYQGFYVETPDQFNVSSVNATTGISTNKKPQNFYKLFLGGRKIKMEFIPKISILKPNTLFNMSRKIQIVMQRNAENVSIICTNDDATVQDEAKKYSIRLFKMKCRCQIYNILHI